MVPGRLVLRVVMGVVSTVALALLHVSPLGTSEV
jgi:hypothetical protein